MHKSVILVIDQGTSSTKAFLFDQRLHQLWTEKICHSVHRKPGGWVESDGEEILRACQSQLDRSMAVCLSKNWDLIAAGMAFQRSTFLFWDKRSRKPVSIGMSWQDSRAKQVADQMVDQGDWIHQIAGIPLSPHFGGPKFLYSIQNDPVLKSKVHRGDLFYGPLSAFITHALTGNAVVDESIAGRSLLVNLHQMKWDNNLIKLFQVTHSCLPELVPSLRNFGTISTHGMNIPLYCVVGDQQASLIGQGGRNRGDAAMNFGTSGSVLVNCGQTPIVIPSLLTSVLYSSEDGRYYLLEGTINSVSALFKWLEGYFDISHEEMQWSNRCHCETNGILVPGVNGISAPYWTGEFETVFDDTLPVDEVVRAGMESIGFLVYDIMSIIQNETPIKIHDITASGGASRPVLLQFIADLLDKPIMSTTRKDMTALGVARLVAEQIWNGNYHQRETEMVKKFQPTMDTHTRQKKIEQWRNALRQLNITS